MNTSTFAFENQRLRISICSITGGIAKITVLPSGRSVLRSAAKSPPFALCAAVDGDTRWLTPAPRADAHPVETPQGPGVDITYPHMLDGEIPIPIWATLRIILQGQESNVIFSLSLRTKDSTYRIHSVQLPCLQGLHAGDDPANEVLLLPNCGGERLENPMHTLLAPVERVPWQWQNYTFSHAMGGPAGKPDGTGGAVRELLCTGPGSMPWMDLSHAKEGIGCSLFMLNPDHDLCAIRAGVSPDVPEGLCLSFAQYPRMTGDGCWKSNPCVLAVHNGDWHEGVDIWRRFAFELPHPGHPTWLSQTAGLAAHYDFVYQDGGMVHTFWDIPGLYQRAQAQGLCHLLLAGWHTDGFDRGFPEYRPHEALGGEDALQQAVAEVHAMGGRVSFYVNVRLCNTTYAHRHELIEVGAVRQPNGEKAVEQYGDEGLAFACMCSQSEDWQAHLVDTARYLANVIGADGLYLDQLALAPAKICDNPHHGFADGWNRGYQALLRKLRAIRPEAPLALMIQGCGDSFGQLASGQLLSTLSMLHSGAFCTLYRYAFPNELLIEMMTPQQNQRMQPPPVAVESTFLIHHAFVHGLYFWVYDLEGETTFQDDPAQWERLRRTLALRNAWLSAYGSGVFRDTREIAYVPAGWMAKRYTLCTDCLIACANEHPAPGTLRVRWPHDSAPRAYVRAISHPDWERPVPCRWRDGIAHIDLPGEELLLVRLQP